MDSAQEIQIQKPNLSSFSSNFQPVDVQTNGTSPFSQQHFTLVRSEHEVKFI